MADRRAAMVFMLIGFAFAFAAMWVPPALAAGTPAPPQDYAYYSSEPESENCLHNKVNGLTDQCAKQVYLSISGRKVVVTDFCCRKVIGIGKNCWSILLSLQSDDPCHYFRFVVDHCKKVVGINTATDDAHLTASECNIKY